MKKIKEKFLKYNSIFEQYVLDIFNIFEEHSSKLIHIYICIGFILFMELITDTIWLSCLAGFGLGLYKEHLDSKYGPGRDIRDLSRYAVGIIIAGLYLYFLKLQNG